MEINNLQIAVKQNAGVISFNFEEMKEALEEKMQIYTNLEMSEDKKPELKKDLATLRKIEKAIDNRRIEVKKAHMQPYEQFDKQVKELMSIIENPISLIDSKVKEYDKRVKEAKKTAIKELYNSLIGDLAEYTTLEKIYQPGWENNATSMKRIREEIENKLSAIALEVDTIKGNPSDDAEEALNVYKRTGSLAEALAHINRYEADKAKIIAREKAMELKRQEEEAERIRKEEAARKLKEQAENKQQQASISEPSFIDNGRSIEGREAPFAVKEEPFATGEAPFTVNEEPFDTANNEADADKLITRTYHLELNSTHEKFKETTRFLDGMKIKYDWGV